jgi:hypothetical protein
MGQAKIRKKNGTYPTREQIAQMAEYDRRINTRWYPTADELPLLHIPEDVRVQLRQLLARWLGKLTHTGGNTQRVGIKQGECYRVAQALVLTAKDPNVVYVEGVWGRGGSPHAWAMVDGYCVDPINELFVWRDGEREQWYEPFQEFNARRTTRGVSRRGWLRRQDHCTLREGRRRASVLQHRASALA